MDNPFFLLDQEDGREAQFCTVLFLDIVDFTKMQEEEQLRAFSHLHKALSQLDCFNEYSSENYEVIPSGDGVAVCFFGEFSDKGWKMPISVAKELQIAMKDPQVCSIRQGMNIGRAYRLSDKSGLKTNVIGNAINIAARAMDFGDADHILCTEHYYESAFKNSGSYSRWFERMPDAKDKHGEIHHLYNMREEPSFGNKKVPEKIIKQAEKTIEKDARIIYRKRLDMNISAGARNSIAIPTTEFSLDQGSIHIKCDVNSTLLARKHNAYFFAHATNGGMPIKKDKVHPYSDVIAVGFNPIKKQWFFWTASTEGIDNYVWHKAEFSEGVHDLFASWDKTQNQLLFAVDHVDPVKKETNSWPSRRADSAIIGAWPWPLDIFYANSKIIEVSILNSYQTWEEYKKPIIK